MEWKDIPNYEGLYQVSDTGLVRRTGLYSNQVTTWKSKPRILKPGDNGKGYKFVNLSKENKTKQYYLHRLVAEAFLDDPGVNEVTVNHKDGDKSNNQASNLEWLTYSDNNNHAYKHLKKQSNRNNKSMSKPVEQLDLQGNVIDVFPSGREAMRQTKAWGVHDCCKGRRETSGGFRWRYQKV